MEAAFEAVAVAAAEAKAVAVAAAEANDEVACVEPPPPSTEKKSNLWLNGVLSCMSSVLRVFGKADLINEYGE